MKKIGQLGSCMDRREADIVAELAEPSQPCACSYDPRVLTEKTVMRPTEVQPEIVQYGDARQL